MKTKSALSYFGSDSEVAEQLAAMLDHCKHVTIPFVGGASIIPHLKARAIVANDLHALAINFYRVLSGHIYHRDSLIELCKHTLSHPDEMRSAQDVLSSSEQERVIRAWAFWTVC